MRALDVRLFGLEAPDTALEQRLDAALDRVADVIGQALKLDQ